MPVAETLSRLEGIGSSEVEFNLVLDLDENVASSTEHRFRFWADDPDSAGIEVARLEYAGTTAEFTSYATTRNLGSASQPWTNVYANTAVLSGTAVSWPANAIGQLENDGAGNLSWVGASSHTHSSADITIPNIATAAYTTLTGYIDSTGSSAVVSGGIITDGGSGTVDVSASEVYLRSSNSTTAPLFAAETANVTGLALTDLTLNYVYVDYNSGTPIVNATTTPAVVLNNPHQNVVLGTVYRSGTVLHISNLFVPSSQLNQLSAKRAVFLEGFQRESGTVTSEVGTRNIAVTAGNWWMGFNEFTTAALDTSASDTFSTWYYNGSAWVETTGQTQIDNTQYNNTATGLVTLSNNKYGVHWVYIDPTDDSYNVVYGTGDYTLITADAALPPSSLPPFFSGFHTALIAKIIVKKSASSFTSVKNPFVTVFGQSGAVDHSELSGLANDDHTQYLLEDGTRPLSANWDAGSFDIRAQTLTADGLTSGRVVYATTNGQLTDSANFTFDGAGALGVSGTVIGHVGVLIDNASTNGTARAAIRLRTAAATANLYQIFARNDELFVGEDSVADWWKWSALGHFVPGTDSTYDIGLTGTRVRAIYADDMELTTSLGVGVAAPGVSSAISAGAHGHTMAANDVAWGSASNNRVVWDDDGNTFTITGTSGNGFIYDASTGNAAFGTSINTTRRINQFWNNPNASGTYQGGYFQINMTNTSNHTGFTQGLFSKVTAASGFNHNELIALEGDATTNASHTAGTVSALVGVRSNVDLDGAGDVTTVQGFNSIVQGSGSGSVTTVSQFRANDVTGPGASATNIYAFHQLGTTATNLFESSLELGVSLGVGVAAPGTAGHARVLTAFGVGVINASSVFNVEVTSSGSGPQYAQRIHGSITSTDDDVQAMFQAPTLAPGNNKRAVGLYSGYTIDNTAGTVDAYGCLITDPAETGTGTTVNQFGIYINAQTRGTTNWGLYSAHTGLHAMLGHLRIGSVAGSANVGEIDAGVSGGARLWWNMTASNERLLFYNTAGTSVHSINTAAGTWFNITGETALDFIVGTSGNTQAFVIDAGTDEIALNTFVNMGDASDAALTGEWSAQGDSTGTLNWRVRNNNNANTAAHARLDIVSGGSAGGDPYIYFLVSGEYEWHAGIDNSDSNTFKIGRGIAVGTTTSLEISPTDIVTATTGLEVGDLTSGRVAYIGASGRLTDDSGLLYSTGAGLVGNDAGSSDIDLRWETANLTHGLFVDASGDFVGIGTSSAPGFGAVLYTARTVTDAAGAYTLQMDLTQSPGATQYTNTSYTLFGNAFFSGTHANNTGVLGGMRYDVYQTGSSGLIGTLQGMAVNIRLDDGGSVTNAIGFRSGGVMSGAGDVTTWHSFEAANVAPSSTGQITTMSQYYAADLTDADVLTKIGFHQVGTNAHNRFQGSVTIGADAAPTSGYELDVIGDIRTTTLESTQTTGTAPFTVASTTLVTNLNADLLDGQHASAFLTAETNDLSSVVTWANVPDANITESSVTQHEAALTILESQITDSTILARVAGNETISGTWEFTAATRFNSSMLQIDNPAQTFQYVVIGSAIAADRNVTLPLLTGADTFVFNDFAATLTNKTIDLANNTVTGTKAEFDTAVSDGDPAYRSSGADNRIAVFNATDTVEGDANFLYNNGTAGNTALSLTQAVNTSGQPQILYLKGGAHTTTLADTEVLDIDIDLNRTVQITNTVGTLATQRSIVLRPPTLDSDSPGFTITDATTLFIEGAPAAGPNVTITNPWSMWVQGSTARFDVNVRLHTGSALEMAGATSGTLTHTVPATVTDYTINWPSAQASGTQVLQNNGSGTLSWATATTGTVTDNNGADTRIAVFSSTTEVTGDANFLYDDGTTGATAFTLTQGVNTTGTPEAMRVTGGAHTTLTASTEATDIHFDLARTVQFATGALSLQRAVQVTQPTYAFVGASTITDAATFYIAGAPVAGTNATITNPWALWVDAGVSRFDGGVQAGDLTSGRVTYATTSGRLTDSSNFLWNGTKLIVAGTTSQAANLSIGSGAQGAGDRDALVLDADGPRLYFNTGATHRNWKISAQDSASQTFEISYSNANSATALGDTFVNALTIDGTTGIVDMAQGLEVSDLTSGRVVYASTNGRLVDDEDLLYTSGTLTVGATTASANIVVNTTSAAAIAQYVWQRSSTDVWYARISTTDDDWILRHTSSVDVLRIDETTFTATWARGMVINETANTAGDLRVETANDVFALFVDASTDTVNIGDSSGQSVRKLSVSESWTHTSAERQGIYALSDSDPASASTGTTSGIYGYVRHKTAFNAGGIRGLWSDVETISGFSAGNVTRVQGAYIRGRHDGAGTVSEWNDIDIATPLGAGAGTITTWHQLLLRDLSGLTITNRIAIRQLGTNAHSRLQGDVMIGADATPGATLEVRGDAIFNEAGGDNDFRVESQDRTHSIYLDASSATGNIALCASSAPSWGGMADGIFIENASAIPTSDPSGGGFLYVNGGALVWHGSSGTVTTLAPA